MTLVFLLPPVSLQERNTWPNSTRFGVLFVAFTYGDTICAEGIHLYTTPLHFCGACVAS